MNRKSIFMVIMVFILTLSFFNTKIVYGYSVHIKEVLSEHVKYDPNFYGLPESTYILAGVTMKDIVNPLDYTVEVKWDTNTEELPFQFYTLDHAFYMTKLGYVPPTSFDDWENKSYTLYVNDTAIHTDTIADGDLRELSIPEASYNGVTKTISWNSVEYADGYAVRILNSTNVDDLLFHSGNLGLVNQYTFEAAYHSLLDSGAILSVEAWDYIPGNLNNTSIYVTNSRVLDDVPIAEIIGTWSSGIWYWDVAASKWTQMTTSIPTGDIAAGDFNGDAKADVASTWSSGLWYQDGATLNWTKVSNTAPTQVTAGDLTGDDRAEIIGTWSNGIWYWDVAASKWTQMTAWVPTGDIAAGDFTDDGMADIASCWSDGLWYQDGATLDWTKVSNTAPTQVTAGDVTGDGRYEIIGTWSSGIWIYSVAFSHWAKMTSDIPDGAITAGDFTGDGRSEVASCWDSGLWYQDWPNLGWTKVSNTAPNQLTAGDVTGD